MTIMIAQKLFASRSNYGRPNDQEQAIPVREVDTITRFPLQHDQLMSGRRVLCLKSALRLEQRGQQGQEEAEQRDHRR